MISRVSLCVASCIVAGSAVRLDADTPWVLPPTTSYNVFGIQPLVLGTYFPYTDYIHQGPKQELAPPYPPPEPTAIGPFVFLGDHAALVQTLPSSVLAQVEAALGTAKESHGCFVVDASPPAHSYDAVVCTGVDEYATYELSHLLGVDPQAYWTENVPQPQQHVNVTAPPSPTPAGTAMLTRVGGGQLSPTFEYRGFFVNDEDMLSGFAADPLGEAVFSVAMWDRVYELILRLKGNAVIVGTAAFKTDAARGALISAAMAAQAAVVRNATGQANPPMFTYLWSEMTPLYTGGHLKIPPGVTVVHADSGDGIVNPLSLSLAQAGDGLYFHLAVEGGKQTTENIPPARIFDTIGKFVKKNATKIVIVNLSDIKPVPAGTAAAMSFLWNPAPMMAVSPAVAEHQFLASWCKQQYGVEGGAAVLPVMSAYFSNPYFAAQTEGKWVGEGDLAGDLRTLAQQTTSFVDPTMFPAGFPWPGCPAAPMGCPMPSEADAADAAIKAHGAVALANAYAAALKAAPLLPLHRQRFYASHVVTQFAIWSHTTAALQNMSAVITSVRKKDYADAAVEAAAGLGHIEALLAAERAGEGGVWAGWHLHDWLDGFSNLRDSLRQLVQVLGDRVATAEAVELLSVAPTKCCFNSVIGGTFNCSSASVELAAISPTALHGEKSRFLTKTIRYTLANGTAAPVPTASTGTVYVEGTPVRLRGPTAKGCNPCSIAAQVFDADGVGLEPITRATYSAPEPAHYN
eukprot:gene14674-4592_t